MEVAHHMMNEAEALSLRASAVLAELVDVEMASTGCDFATATARVMDREAHLRAAYAGDAVEFKRLSAGGRSARMALPAGGTHERRFKRGAPPRALSSRRIADRSELLPGETACLKLAPDGSGGGLYAERIAA
jgi:hypothetical protein